MKISTKGRYALCLLTDLAEHRNDGYISLKEISERQNISKKYLEQIIPMFSKTDVLKANRGALGGYMLAKDPDKYSVGEILRITEGSLSPVDYIDEEPIECERTADYAMLSMWQGLSKLINDYLDGITLADLVEKQREQYANDYMI